MSGAGYSSAPDVTGIRRNPGVGHYSGLKCAVCGKTHHDRSTTRMRVFGGSSRLLLCKDKCKGA